MQLAAEANFPAAHPEAGDHRPAEVLAYDVGGAARIMGVSRSTVFNLLRDGRLEARKLGKKTLITRAAIEKWLANLPARAA